MTTVICSLEQACVVCLLRASWLGDGTQRCEGGRSQRSEGRRSQRKPGDGLEIENWPSIGRERVRGCR